METCSVSLDLGASSQLAATIIGSSQRLFSLAEVYDVSDDAWLGKGNNMRLITRTFDRSHALALNSDGGMKLFHKASKALSRAKSHGCKVGFGATTELTERFCQISAEFKLASILNKSRATFWNAQQSGQEIGIWYFKEIGRSAELVVKVEKSLSDLTFAHNKCDREGKNVGHHGTQGKGNAF